MTWEIKQGDALETLKTLESESVQCVVTSPPYYGLRDYGVAGQLGLEQRPDCLGWATGEPCGECYICRMVAVFQEVRRVLRNDGTLWLNMGDSYAQDSKWGGESGGKNYTSREGNLPRRRRDTGLKDKNLMGIPWRLAFALQADGWYLRSDIIWHKTAPMPESVKDRPTRSHEFIFLLSKSERYYYDQEAVREAASPVSIARISQPNFANQTGGAKDYRNGVNTSRSMRNTLEHFAENPGRNQRDVWTINPANFSEAHFATFPPELPERCIKAGTSERGCCPECGAPWIRTTERQNESNWQERKDKYGAQDREKFVELGRRQQVGSGWSHNLPSRIVETIGWCPACAHDAEPIPCTVLDIFSGAGTTLLVAARLGRNAIGIELNPAYVEMAKRRIASSNGATVEQAKELAADVQIRLF